MTKHINRAKGRNNVETISEKGEEPIDLVEDRLSIMIINEKRDKARGTQ